MILMSLNVRGLASLPKKLAVKRLIDLHSADVLFIQETMIEGGDLVHELELMIHGWHFISVDALGRSGGLILGWKSCNFLFINAWALRAGLCAVLFDYELQKEISFVNLYAPYLDRESFWNNLTKLDCLLSPFLVFGGDLNFSMGLSEIWGVHAQIDPLTNFFQNLLENMGLVDISPLVSIPSWSNRRAGEEGICKRLDRLLVSADFLDYDFLLNQWIGCGGVSDHQPVFLQISSPLHKAHSPFKFNADWLDHLDLVDALKSSWVRFNDRSTLSPEAQFCANLKRIKDISTKWSLSKKAQNIKDMADIEFELKSFHDSHSSGILSVVEKDLLTEIESRKQAILLFREKEAR